MFVMTTRLFRRLYHILNNMYIIFFFFNDTATTEIYTLSLHDALPIFILLIVFMLGGLQVSAQPDMHFSQFGFAPSTLNPATTGAFDGLWREIGRASCRERV